MPYMEANKNNKKQHKLTNLIHDSISLYLQLKFLTTLIT